jgi:hypothetical protein
MLYEEDLGTWFAVCSNRSPRAGTDTPIAALRLNDAT